jgi:outer membrane immunogenic protein
MWAWSRLGCAAIAISVANIVCAEAADLGVGGPPPVIAYPAAPVRFFSWTGCYLGGHVGGAFADNQITGTFLGPTGPFINSALINVANTLPIDFGANSFLIGGQGGCNLEFTNRWVIGFEADVSWANAEGSSRQTVGGTFLDTFGFPASASADGALTVKSDFTATATARFGYAFGSIGQGLIYGKAGAAWIANRYSLIGALGSAVCVSATIVPPQCLVSSAFITPFDWTGRETRLGWTIGAGVEWAMWGNWSIKGEYNYLDFGSRTVTLADPLLGAANASVRQIVNEAKFGVNYRFGASPQPWY